MSTPIYSSSLDLGEARFSSGRCLCRSCHNEAAATMDQITTKVSWKKCIPSRSCSQMFTAAPAVVMKLKALLKVEEDTNRCVREGFSLAMRMRRAWRCWGESVHRPVVHRIRSEASANQPGRKSETAAIAIMAKRPLSGVSDENATQSETTPQVTKSKPRHAKIATTRKFDLGRCCASAGLGCVIGR